MPNRSDHELVVLEEKTATKDSADISPEDSDNDMTGQESRDEESPDQDLADSEFAKKSGLYERMKAGFAALTQRTKKHPHQARKKILIHPLIRRLLRA